LTTLHPVTTQKISAFEELLPLLEKVLQTAKPLMIIAEDVDGKALAAAHGQRDPKRRSGRRG